MFLDKPDVASRYPNRLTGEMRLLVFDRSYFEEVYHVAAYTLYRLKLLLSNKRIDQRYSKLRWHIIMAIKYYVCGDDIPKLSSGKIKKSCEVIEKFMNSGDESTVKAINGLCGSIVDIDEITRDKLKGSTLAMEVKSRALKFRRNTKLR